MSSPEAMPPQTVAHPRRSGVRNRRRPAHLAPAGRPPTLRSTTISLVPAVVDEAEQDRTPAHLGPPARPTPDATSTRGLMVLKTAVDRTGALLLLLVSWPLLLAVGVAIRVSSAGPALYRQQRVGLHGRPFRMVKFRTMTSDAEAHQRELAAHNETDGLLFKLHDDPRVTSVGRFLRRTSLDELPQLWNVLVGDMSLVGPRPLPVRADEITGPERRRLDMRPGLTGMAQVNGRSDLCWAETVRLDVEYVDRWSLRLDAALLARTPLVVVRGRGAY